MTAAELAESMSEPNAQPLRTDYDRDPERFRAGVRTVERYAAEGDVHGPVAERLHAERLEPVLDLGCGEGRLINPLRTLGVRVVGFDTSPTMLAGVPDPRVRGEAGSLPFDAGSFGSVAALYMLYHFGNPKPVIAERRRVLRRGGLFAACAPSRYDHPELKSVLPEDDPTTFDAENGPDMLRECFQDVEIERWDGPHVHLPDREAVALYLYGRGLAKAEADEAASKVPTPLDVTKRGALMFGHKRD
jgi:SAM-dependent methyltransferase